MLHLKDDMDVSSLTFLGTIAHILGPIYLIECFPKVTVLNLGPLNGVRNEGFTLASFDSPKKFSKNALISSHTVNGVLSHNYPTPKLLVKMLSGTQRTQNRFPFHFVSFRFTNYSACAYLHAQHGSLLQNII